MTSFVIILPLFARRFDELGAGVEALGVSAMAYALTATLAAPFMGALADRIGRKPVVVASLAVYALAFCGYRVAQSAAALILLRGLAGAFTAGLIPAVTSLAADLAPADRKAQWIGFMNAGASVGWVAGPLLGGLLYDHWGYNLALLVSIGLALLSLLVAWMYIPHSAPTPAHPRVVIAALDRFSPSKQAQATLERFRSTLPEALASFAILLFIFFAVMFAWAFIEPRFMFYAYNDLGWTSSMLGLAMSAYGVAMVIGEIACGRLSDRLGRKPVILLGLALFSAQFIGLASFHDYLLIALAFSIAGLGNALYDPALSAAMLDISPQEHRSRTLGLKSMIGSFGSILGPALVALLNATMPARSIFLIAVVAMLLTTLFVLVSKIEVTPPEKMSWTKTPCRNRQEGEGCP